MSDILLSVGFSTEDLKKSYSQIQSALSGLPTAMPLTIKPGETQLVDQYGKSLKSVSEVIKEAGESTKGLGGQFGKLLSRISIWSLAWTAAYSALRETIKIITEAGVSVAQLNDSIASTRVILGETSSYFKEKYSGIRKEIIDTAYGSTISVKELSKAFETMIREGASTKEALTGLATVRNLMVVSGEKENVVAGTLIESYKFLGQQLKTTGTEQERFNTLADFFTAISTKAGLSMREQATMLSKVAAMYQLTGQNLNFLGNMIIFADDAMFSGKQAAAALSEALSKMSFDTAEVNKILGATIATNSSFVNVLLQIKDALKGYTQSEQIKLLWKVFGEGSTAASLVNLAIQKTDAEIQNFNTDLKQSTQEMAEAKAKAHAWATGLNDAKTSIVESVSWVDKLTQSIEKMQLAVAKKTPYWGRSKGQIELLEKEYLEEIKKAKELAALQEDVQTQSFITPSATEADRLKRLHEQAAVLTEIDKTSRESIKTMQDSIAISDYELSLTYAKKNGTEQRYISELKLNALIDNRVSKLDEEIQSEERKHLETAKTLALQGDIAGAYGAALQFTKTEAEATTIVNEFLKERTNILKEQSEISKKNYEEINALASSLQSNTEGYIKNLLAGQNDVKGFLAGVADSYREAFAKNLTQTIADTGLFGNMAEAFMSPIQKMEQAHVNGIKLAVPLIVQAHIDGIKQANALLKSTGATISGGAPGGDMWDYLKKPGGSAEIGQVGGSNMVVPIAPADYYKGAAAKAGGMDFAKAGALGGKALGYAGGLYSGYSGIQAARQPGGGGALSGAMSGAMAGSMFGIWGMAIGAIAGAIFGGKKKKVEEPAFAMKGISQVESQIKLSNAHLQAISRNTNALNRGFEKYLSIAPQSAYFSEAQGIESRFLRSKLMILA